MICEAAAMNRRQTIPKRLRYTLGQFKAEFSTDDVCLDTIMRQRYPGGVTYCSDCGEVRKLYRVNGRTAFACEVGHQFYPLAGTIFEKSTTPLHIWFYAMYQMGSTRCGMSAKQIQRETGVTYKTAWRMFRQIRSLLSESDMQQTVRCGRGRARGRLCLRMSKLCTTDSTCCI